jgi:hypothetical protein
MTRHLELALRIGLPAFNYVAVLLFARFTYGVDELAIWHASAAAIATIAATQVIKLYGHLVSDHGLRFD